VHYLEEGTMSQIGAPLVGSYDYGEVARSILIAIAASYAALDLGGRVTAARGSVRSAWLIGGAIAMGIGIWAMHFKGMIAFRLPIKVEYHWPTVLASLVIGVLSSAIALYVASRQKMGPAEAWTGSLIMGGGIAAMHYVGMAAMRMAAVARFDPLLVALSVVLAILFSRIALMFTFDYRGDFRGTTLAKIVSAAVMGVAISLMHYSGMAAVSFMPAALVPNLSHTVNISPLSNNGIAIVTFIVLGTALLTSSVDRQTQAEVWRRNESLEQRVVERTRQLTATNEELRREIAERRRAEVYLAMSQRMARMGVWSWNPSSGDMFGSEEFYRIFGIDYKTKLTREVFLQRIYPEDRPRYESEISTAIAERRNWELDYRIVLPDSLCRDVHAIGRPVFNKSGDVLEIVGTTLDITERKRAEQELRLAQERIRAILENSHNLIFLKDTEGRYLLVNREFERALRVSQEQIKSKTDEEVFPPEQAAASRANDLEVLRAGVPMEFEEISVQEDGPHISIVHKFPLYDARGEIYATGGIATDITERKRLEEARRHSEEQYRTVVETAIDAVVSIDEDSKILFVNPATTQIFGYHSSELIGSPLTMLMPESLRELHKTGMRRFLATGQRHMNWQGVELTGLRKNGKELPVEVSFGEITSEGRHIFTGFIRDITERKRAEEALRSSAREQRQMVALLERERARLVEAQEVAKMGSWEMELRNLSVIWSEQSHRIFETDPSRFHPTRPNFLKFVHPDDRAKVDAAFAASLDKRSPSTVEYRIVMPDGRIKFIEERWQAFHDEEGKPVRLSGTCRDITERVRAEEELQRLSGKLLRWQDEERRRIARDLHDSTGQDLVALATMLGQLGGLTPSTERKKRWLISECGALAEKCVREVRTLSYVLHPPVLDQAGLEDAIRDYVKGFTNRTGIRVELELSPRIGRMAREIELALFRVVQESLTNIHRHSGSNRAKIRMYRNSELKLEISDIGHGLSPSEQRGKEEPGFELGVGIPSMQERVKLIGGRLEIDSSSQGTTVRAMVPLRENEHEKTAHSDS
jgi:PAS domain S-box-containing protein